MINKQLLIDLLKASNEEIVDVVVQKLYAIEPLKTEAEIIVDKDWVFVYRDPKLPILVAHMDIAQKRGQLKDDYIVANDRFIWSPLGIGGDDRCGVYALMELAHLEVNLLFTHWEEIGGIGAQEFVVSEIAEKIDPPYFIELDRRGIGDCVAYNCDEDNEDWYKKIDKFFNWTVGSFSDIEILGRYWQVCSVNLSIGFFHEHTTAEYIDLIAMEKTIGKVPLLLAELGKEKYELPMSKYSKSHWYGYGYGYGYGYDWDYDKDWKLSKKPIAEKRKKRRRDWYLSEDWYFWEIEKWEDWKKLKKDN
ncbi:MAG: hypothetical protein QXD60_02395 [Nanopusillaceae archaeon]